MKLKNVENLLEARKSKTGKILVKNKNSGSKYLINPDHFDKTLHRKLSSKDNEQHRHESPDEQLDRKAHSQRIIPGSEQDKKIRKQDDQYFKNKKASSEEENQDAIHSFKLGPRKNFFIFQDTAEKTGYEEGEDYSIEYGKVYIHNIKMMKDPSVKHIIKKWTF